MKISSMSVTLVLFQIDNGTTLLRQYWSTIIVQTIFCQQKWNGRKVLDGDTRINRNARAQNLPVSFYVKKKRVINGTNVHHFKYLAYVTQKLLSNV